MTTRYWVRKAHRYLGIFVGIQLLMWTMSGIYFTWNDIETVRGEHLIEATPVDLRENTDLQALAPLLDSFDRPVERVELRMLEGRPVYEVRMRSIEGMDYRLIEARTAEVIDRIDEQTAIAVASADFAPDTGVAGVELLTEASPHDEYRGADLPVYRVSMDHLSGVNIYVSARRGIVVARRTTIWRIFDFLWMMHTMDYQTRDDFNNSLIQVLSVLGIVTVLSGFLLWGLTSPVFRGRGRRAV